MLQDVWQIVEVLGSGSTGGRGAGQFQELQKALLMSGLHDKYINILFSLYLLLSIILQSYIYIYID